MRQVEQDHRRTGQLLEADLAPAGERVVVREDHRRWEFGEQFDLEFVRQPVGVGQRHFAAPAAQALEDFGLVALLDVERDFRVAERERGEQAGQQEGRERDEAGCVDLAALRAAHRAGELLELACVGEEPPRLHQKAVARERQRQPLGMVADEELDLEVGLQPRDCGRNRRLRHPDLLGARRHAAGFGGGDEIAQRAQRQAGGGVCVLHRVCLYS